MRGSGTTFACYRHLGCGVAAEVDQQPSYSWLSNGHRGGNCLAPTGHSSTNDSGGNKEQRSVATALQSARAGQSSVQWRWRVLFGTAS
jgi:hypothetical protein